MGLAENDKVATDSFQLIHCYANLLDCAAMQDGILNENEVVLYKEKKKNLEDEFVKKSKERLFEIIEEGKKNSFSLDDLDTLFSYIQTNLKVISDNNSEFNSVKDLTDKPTAANILNLFKSQYLKPKNYQSKKEVKFIQNIKVYSFGIM
jgi:hypothetical protein